MTGARQTIALIINFRTPNTNTLERRTGDYSSNKKGNPLISNWFCEKMLNVATP